MSSPVSGSRNSGLTTVQMIRGGLYAVSATTAIGAAILGGKIYKEGASLAKVLLMPFCALSSMVAISWAKSFKDYEDPKELETMVEEARALPLPTLLQDHKEENLVRKILPKLGQDVAKAKVHDYIQRNLSQVDEALTVPPSCLEDQVSPRTSSLLKTARGQLAEARTAYCTKRKETDQAYPGRTDYLDDNVDDIHSVASVGVALVTAEPDSDEHTANGQKGRRKEKSTFLERYLVTKFITTPMAWAARACAQGAAQEEQRKYNQAMNGARETYNRQIGEARQQFRQGYEARASLLSLPPVAGSNVAASTAPALRTWDEVEAHELSQIQRQSALLPPSTAHNGQVFKRPPQS